MGSWIVFLLLRGRVKDAKNENLAQRRKVKRYDKASVIVWRPFACLNLASFASLGETLLAAFLSKRRKTWRDAA